MIGRMGAKAVTAESTISNESSYVPCWARHNWPTAVTIDITPDFTPGVYVVLARGPDGDATAAPLVVRDDAGPHALTVIEPTLTWQAYNKWGGANLYQYPAADGRVSGDAQADVVTLDRPFVSLTAGNQLLQQDLGLIQLGERDGLDVDYIADEDLESASAPVMQTHALVMSRHDEYWSAGMRATANKMVLDGVNLLDLGGNNMYHAGRFLDPARRFQGKVHGEVLITRHSYEEGTVLVQP